jgi:hypothetical protein
MMTGISGEVSAPAVEAEVESVEQVETAPKEAPQDEFADKFMRLTRKERALQQAQSELKTKMIEIEKMKAEYDGFLSRKSKVKENPFDALEMLGVSFDEITQALLSQGQPVDKFTELEKKIAAFEERENQKQENEKSAKEQELEATRQKTVEGFKDNLAKFIDTSDYELIKANEAAETVFEVIKGHYEETEKLGSAKLLSYEDACKLVEEHLESQLPKLKSLNKVKAMFELQEDKLSTQAQVNQPRASGSTTLTNAMRVSTEPATPQHRRPSEEERFKAAASMIKFS